MYVFKQNYHNIKPWRSYDDPILAAKNIKKARKNTAKIINKISQNMLSITSKTSLEISSTTRSKTRLSTTKKKEDNICGVCLERPKKVVLDPCGHYAYCLECIKNLANCPDH